MVSFVNITTSVPYFEDLRIALRGAVVLLDVDGTITPDADDNFSVSRKKIDELIRHNRVYICTNTRNARRAQRVARSLNLPLAGTKHKKPSKKILKDIGMEDKNVLERNMIVVIGDKFLTDYVFARRIGARFVPVRRKISGRERLSVKIIYMIDDLARIWYGRAVQRKFW